MLFVDGMRTRKHCQHISFTQLPFIAYDNRS